MNAHHSAVWIGDLDENSPARQLRLGFACLEAFFGRQHGGRTARFAPVIESLLVHGVRLALASDNGPRVGLRSLGGAQELRVFTRGRHLCLTWQDRKMPGFHHVELWVGDFAEAQAEWGWLLSRLDFELAESWGDGQTWSAGGAYLTITTSPNLSTPLHDRRRAGVNHLAFKAESAAAVDRIIADAPAYGWRPLYQDRYPHAGGEDHYAGWIENTAGFKAEIVAMTSPE